MRYLVLLPLFFLISLISKGQDICVGNEELCVIQFNASFNSSNSVDWCEDLTDCSTSDVDIMKNADLQKQYKIVVVPTILILDDGEEVGRFQANIMMVMEATKEEVQEKIDEIIMSNF